MRKNIVWTLAAILSIAVPAFAQHPDHAATVNSVKTALQAQGRDLSGACGAFAITKRVAWALRSESAGVLSKPNGNNCDGFATDIIMYPDGKGYDILGDAGGANGPGWGDAGVDDPSRYHAAFDPGDAPSPAPTPGPMPSPAPGVDLGPVLVKLDDIANRISAFTDRVAESQKALLDSTEAIAIVVKDTNAHVVNIDKTFGQTMGAVGAFFGKYIAPAIGGFLIARKTGG